MITVSNFISMDEQKNICKKSIISWKILVISFIFIFFTTPSFSQKVKSENVPASVKETFKKKFPDVNKVKWEFEDKVNYEANFKKGSTQQSASFDKSGNWLETETEIKINELPPAIAKAVAKDYLFFKIKETSRIDDHEFGSCFEVEIVKGKDKFDVLLSSDGKTLKKEKAE